MRLALSTILALSLATAAPAHAPVVNDKEAAYSLEQPYVVDDPEHSKAIFSELQGAPQFYRITSDAPFRFYAGIMQAKLDGCEMTRTFSFDVYRVANGKLKRIDGRDGSDFDWWPWYEEYGKTWYWVGPEIGADFKGNRTYEAGTYYIKVHNAENTGRYVVAIGDIEQFGVGTIASMLLNGTMKKVREGWWDEGLCPTS